jgi:hypothetical protein
VDFVYEHKTEAQDQCCALHVLDRRAQVGAQTIACDDATLPQQEKSNRQINRRTE